MARLYFLIFKPISNKIFSRLGDSEPNRSNSLFFIKSYSFRDKYEIISFDMNPGDILAFHALVVHGSSGNFSKDRRRRGYAVRYTGKEVFYCTEK